MFFSEPTNNFSYSDKIREVSFQVYYNLVKSGPSTIDNAYVVIQIPTKIIEVDKVISNYNILQKFKIRFQIFQI